MEEALGIEASMRGSKVFLQGEEKAVNKAGRFIKELYSINSNGYAINPEDMKFVLKALDDAPLDDQISADSSVDNNSSASLKEYFLSNIPVSSKKKFIVPRSETQKEYIDAIKKYDMVIGIGPAGTGKTYLAMAMAINALLTKQVSRIILARPAVEAGERLGFLP
ncbi:MAG: PhoH family protein, partial [Nitrospiraceae bacterium]